MRRFLKFIAVVAFAVAGTSVYAQKYTGVVDKVAGVVGNEMIKISELESQVRTQRVQGYTSDRNIRCEVLEQMLESKIFLMQARVDSLAVNNDMVDGELRNRIDMLKTNLGGDDLAACEDSDVAEHFLSSVAKAGSLDSNANEGAAELVENESGKSLALYVLSNDKQLSACLNYLLKHGENILNVCDLLVCDEKESVVKNCLHLIHISCHICAEVASIKLHSLNNLAIGFSGLGFLNSDNTVSCYLFHCIRDKLTD